MTGAGYQPKPGKGRASRPPNVGSAGRRSKPNGAAAPLLDRDAILAADDLTTERVDVPEWGGTVLVRALPLAEQGLFEANASEDKSSAEVMARMVALCACDAAGNQLFSLEDVEALGRKAKEPMMRVAQAAIRINSYTESDIEDLAKN